MQPSLEDNLRGMIRGLSPWPILFFIEILQLYSGSSMNQRPFSPITGQPFKVQNYYFQLILLRLIAKRPPPPSKPTYTFTPFKGTQKYESSKPIQVQLGGKDAYPLEKIVLNFVAISYNPSKSLSFAIRMIENGTKVDKEIGEYLLDANNYIDTFMQTENGAFTLKVQLNDDWAAEAELYVERSRYGVERLVRDVKNPKVQEKSEALSISHQAIKEQRRQLDLKDQEQEEESHHANRFKKFSPRRESQEDIQKKTQHFNRKAQEPPKKQTPPEPKKEERKSPKAQFVPKKEWMIPQAEKYMASKTKTTSRSASIHQKPQSIIKQEEKPRRRPPKHVEQPSLMEKLPVQPKYIVVVAILMAIAFAATFFFKSDTPPQDLLKAPKQPKPKKAAEKPTKPQKTVKVKK